MSDNLEDLLESRSADHSRMSKNENVDKSLRHRVKSQLKALVSREKCAICLRKMKYQKIGVPGCCNHKFCYNCLITWSKQKNRCPLDRKMFTSITVSDRLGESLRKISVMERNPVDFICCEFCGLPDRENVLLLCDGCDRGFHMDCLNPPLLDVPQDQFWFCADCSFISEESIGGPTPEDNRPTHSIRRGAGQTNRRRPFERARRLRGIQTRRSRRIRVAREHALRLAAYLQFGLENCEV